MSMFSDTPRKIVACTPSDSTDVTGCWGIYVGTTGNVAVKDKDGNSAVTFVAVPAGAIIPGQFSRIMSTSTTASDIVLFY